MRKAHLPFPWSIVLVYVNIVYCFPCEHDIDSLGFCLVFSQPEVSLLLPILTSRAKGLLGWLCNGYRPHMQGVCPGTLVLLKWKRRFISPKEGRGLGVTAPQGSVDGMQRGPASLPLGRQLSLISATHCYTDIFYACPKPHTHLTWLREIHSIWLQIQKQCVFLNIL